MGNKKKRYRVAIVADFDTPLDAIVLASNLHLVCYNTRSDVNEIHNVVLETFEIEEMEYPDIKAEDLA